MVLKKLEDDCFDFHVFVTTLILHKRGVFTNRTDVRYDFLVTENTGSSTGYFKVKQFPATFVFLSVCHQIDKKGEVEEKSVANWSKRNFSSILSL